MSPPVRARRRTSPAAGLAGRAGGRPLRRRGSDAASTRPRSEKPHDRARWRWPRTRLVDSLFGSRTWTGTRLRRVRESATKADEIARVLEDAILAGELPPGYLLRQEQLSEQFGVSRTPIREALRQLAALGLVSFAGRRGVQVKPLAHAELFEAFVVRAALEGFAAELARERLTAGDLRRLERAEKRFARL